MACNSQSSVSPDTPKDSVAPVPTRPTTIDTTTLGGTWYLEPVPPSDTSVALAPRINLMPEVGRFNGFTGCNPMRGKFYFSKQDSSLSFGDRIIVGRKLCKGYNESGFLTGLKRTGRYRLDNGVLILMMDNRTELSRWRKGKPGLPKT